MSASEPLRRTQLFTVTEVAEQLRCSRGHVYNLIALGDLRSVELKASGARAKTRLRSSDVEAFIDARTSRAAPGR